MKNNPERVAELNKLGFIWERLQPEWNLVLEALISYLSLHGDLLVPTTFVVPHDSEHYPKATWGPTARQYCLFVCDHGMISFVATRLNPDGHN